MSRKRKDEEITGSLYVKGEQSAGRQKKRRGWPVCFLGHGGGNIYEARKTKGTKEWMSQKIEKKEKLGVRQRNPEQSKSCFQTVQAHPY